jgi:hypothetical protein
MITLATNFSGNHKRVKHFLRAINFMIQKVNMKIVKLQFTYTTDMTADTLTKPLSEGIFIIHREKIMGIIIIN